jgi:hypothetical protein
LDDPDFGRLVYRHIARDPEYDQSVAHTLRHGDLESRKKLASVIDQLYELGGELPPRINKNRRRLARQIARAEEGGAVTDWAEWSRQAVAAMHARNEAWIARFDLARAAYRWDRVTAELRFERETDQS